MRKNIARVAALLAVATLAPVLAQDPPAAARLLDRIIAGEERFLARMQRLHPILETYLQETAEDTDRDAPPINDHYMIVKLDLSDDIDYTPFILSPAFQKRSGLLARLSRRNSGLALSPSGFAQMLVPDLYDFNRETYRFEYVRREFLGEVRCLVFDVSPKDRKEAGRFIGRIWVEDQEYNIVRFNGTYTLSKTSSLFFHFDSWRVNVAPNFWAPAYVYIEDPNAGGPQGRKIRYRGQSRLWGYTSVNSGKLGELTNILIQADNPVREDNVASDPSPLESQRSWMRQAEENVLQRLERTGLLAPKGEVDRVLNTVVNNLIVTNQLNVEIQCRVLLTTPLETFSIGRTIVISRGLLDVLPDEASLAVVLSDELAHIALGHRTETMYAFSDQTMFAEGEILSRLRFARPAAEVEAAGKKGLEFLASSPYRDKVANAGLFLKVLVSRGQSLPNLIQASLGNRLASGNNLLRLADLASKAPALDENKLEQIAALPLGSRVKLDPWSNQISLLKTRALALVSAREKMPFEVSPFLIHLTRLPPQREAYSSGGAAASR